MQLRDYQAYAVNSIFGYFEANNGNPLVGMPTGTGKSLAIGGFTKEAIRRYPSTRILMGTHDKRLIEQNFDKLMKLWPQAPAGIYSAGLKQREKDWPIVYGGIASMAKRIEEFGHRDLFLVDEVQLVSDRETAMYQRAINGLRAINPKMKVIGFSATLFRLGMGELVDGELFDTVCCDMTSYDWFNWFVDQGYLLAPVPAPIKETYSAEGIGTSGGDYIKNEVQQATAAQRDVTERALENMVELGYNRHSWMVFAAGVDHAIEVHQILSALNVSCVVVHSRMPQDQVDVNVAMFKAGMVRCIVNADMLTTGFDHPPLDLIAVLRMTKSAGLWVQMLGRGTRPVYADGFDLSTVVGRRMAIAASQKQNCLVLDYAGNTARLGPINDPVKPRPKGKKGPPGVAPIKYCKGCGAVNHARATECAWCGEEFVFERQIETYASTHELVRKSPKIEEPEDEKLSVVDFNVQQVTYTKVDSTKAGVPMMRVEYWCGMRRFDEVVCLEHPEGSNALFLAHKWWRQRILTEPPKTVDEALNAVYQLPQVSRITVDLQPRTRDGKRSRYPRIKKVEFGHVARHDENAAFERETSAVGYSSC